jgi:hypothetical protein
MQPQGNSVTAIIQACACFFGSLFAIMLISTSISGCGAGGEKAGTPSAATQTKGKDTGTETKSTGTTTPKGKLEAIEAKEVAVLKGRVTYDGTPPAPADIKSTVDQNADKGHCHLDETGKSFTDQTWVVGKDGGVANVAVWVLPGDGKYFKVDAASLPREVDTDQPFCAFVPHVQLHMPGITGADKKLVTTGQVFKIKNSAPIAHNTSYQGDPVQGISGNFNLAPKEERVLSLPPSATQVITMVCDRHKWMKGYVWSLPTPFAAVTDKDGNFEIKGIPADAPVKIVFWHEAAGFFGPNGQKGDPVTLKAGDNSRDAKVKAK